LEVNFFFFKTRGLIFLDRRTAIKAVPTAQGLPSMYFISFQLDLPLVEMYKSARAQAFTPDMMWTWNEHFAESKSFY
jgi:hypothetical protein